MIVYVLWLKRVKKFHINELFLCKFQIYEVEGNFYWKKLEELREIKYLALKDISKFSKEYKPFLCRPNEYPYILKHKRVTQCQMEWLSGIAYPVCRDWIKERF